MLLSTWLIFVAVASVSIVSPGPAFLVAIRNGMSGGMPHVILSSLGNIIGLLCLASAAVMGLGVVLRTSEFFFTTLKLCGSSYLIYLGIRQWYNSAGIVMSQALAPARRRLQVFGEGILVAVSNPKAILFFTALFPQFLDTELPITPQFSIMVGTFMAMSFATLVAYGSLARQVVRWLGSTYRVRWANRIIGCVFISLGVSLLCLR